MHSISRRQLLQALMAQPLLAGVARAQARVVATPKPLPAGAVTHDWTSFLGPTHNAVSTETKLSRTLPPPLVWEFPKGTSYSSPAIAGDRLLFIHRVGDEEIVECLDALTGASRWQFKYGTAFEDRYGYNNGPRSSPVIDGTRVYTMGAEGKLHCLDLASGKVLWKRDLRAEYKVPQDFFGTAVDAARRGPAAHHQRRRARRPVRRRARHGDRQGSLARGQRSGGRATRRRCRRSCTASGACSSSPAASPTPPTGGLMSIDPATGKVDFSFPWRSRSYESVNASCPVVFDNKVFISASYRTGGALLADQPRLHAQGAVDDAGVRPALQHADPSRRISVRLRRPQRARRVAGVRGRGDRQGGVARDARVDRDDRRPAGRRVGTYRGSLLAVDGQLSCASASSATCCGWT